MDVESSICLSDLVPALRWSRPQQVAEALADPRLPTAWWASVALSTALGTTGLDWLCERLGRFAAVRWDHLPLGDLLPALLVHQVDPALPGWPEPAKSVIVGLGGWGRLRRLSPGDLATPDAVVTSVFREILRTIPVQAPRTQTPQNQAPQNQAPQTQAPQNQVARNQPAQSQSLPQRPQPAVPAAAEYPLVGQVDNLFKGFEPLELAVAVDRLFAADPISLRALAHRLNVDREVLSLAQRTAEERVLYWLRSSESAPVTGHLFRLTEWLGAAATEDQLIGSDPAHPARVPTLGVPLWRVLVTLMPDRRLQDGWLVVGDLGGLRSRTNQLLAAHPADADAPELLGELGIRLHSAKEWLAAIPAAAAAAAAPPAPLQPLPRRTPGANGHHHRGGQPIPAAPAGQIDPSAALATLSALSGGRSHMLPGSLAGAPATPPPPLPSPTSDPRRWQRIEVTPEHLRGGPVAVPEGYAAQLGMRPGTLLSVTGPGDNAVVLVWRDQQPVFDSLQPVLMRLNARPGDQVYVTVDGYRLDAQLTS